MRKLLLLFGAVALLQVAALPAFAQGGAQVVSSCGTPNGTYNVGQTMPQTQNQDGLHCEDTAGGTSTVQGSQSNAAGGTTGATNVPTNSYTYGWTGSAWAQAAVDSSGRWLVAGAGTAGTPVGGVLSVQGVSSGTALPVSQSGTWTITQASYIYTHIPTATTTAIKSGAGTLHTVCVNSLGTVASAVTVYDNTAGSGTVVAIINSLSFLGCQTYDVAFATGLTVVTTGTVAPDVTVSSR